MIPIDGCGRVIVYPPTVCKAEGYVLCELKMLFEDAVRTEIECYLNRLKVALRFGIEHI